MVIFAKPDARGAVERGLARKTLLVQEERGLQLNQHQRTRREQDEDEDKEKTKKTHVRETKQGVCSWTRSKGNDQRRGGGFRPYVREPREQ